MGTVRHGLANFGPAIRRGRTGGWKGEPASLSPGDERQGARFLKRLGGQISRPRATDRRDGGEQRAHHRRVLRRIAGSRRKSWLSDGRG